MMRLRLLIVFIFIFYTILSFAQSKYYVEVSPFSGIVAPHHSNMASLAKNPVLGGEFNFLISHSEDNIFDKKYNSPFVGYGLSLENLGNPSMLGNSYSIYSLMEFKILSRTKIKLNTRIAGGLSYITKKYDALNNPLNIAIGSSVTFYFNLDLSLYYPIPNSNFELRLSSGLIHNSNGSVKKPNYGLNQFVFSTGLAYKIREKNVDDNIDTESLIIEKPHEFHAMATIIKTEEYSRDFFGRDGNYICSTISAGYNYRYSSIGKLGLSTDLFYNENLYYDYDPVNDSLIRLYNSFKDIARFGISVGHELIYKKIGLVTFLGAYAYKKAGPDDHFYFRVGVRYYPIKNVYINLTLKGFGFKAHYIESGIGFSIYGRRR